MTRSRGGLGAFADSVTAQRPSGGGTCRADERRIHPVVEPPASELVPVDPVHHTNSGPCAQNQGRCIRLHRSAYAAYRRLKAAAEADGIAARLLTIVSGYRSVAHQRTLWQTALRRYGSAQAARRWVAPPGSSPHHTGRAIDFNLGLSNDSGNVPALRQSMPYRWLVCNAARFGFTPYAAEPWHWEYNPPGATGDPGPAPRPAGPPPRPRAPAAPPAPGTPIQGFNAAETKALRITTTFETGRSLGFGGLTGDFDGMGLSFGLLQWNFGSGSLQPLLRLLDSRNRAAFDAAFGPDAGRVRAVLADSQSAQLAFARSINDANHRIVQPWAGYFARLEADPTFRTIQIETARRKMNQAIRYMTRFGFGTERALALMFDTVTQSGGAWIDRGNRAQLIEARRAAFQAQNGRAPTERELCAVIANVVADTSAQRWREDVRRRKMTIVTGRGRVHGRDFDMTRDFGLTDAPWR